MEEAALVQKTKEKQLKATAESCNDNSSNSSNRISFFTPTYHPIIQDVMCTKLSVIVIVIRNSNLRVTLESSDSLKCK